MSSNRFIPISLMAATALLAVACGKKMGDAPGDSANVPAAQTTPAASGPRVSITSPAEGDTIPGDSVTVVMAVEGVKLVPAAAAQIEGEGHLHLFVDVPVSRADIPIPPNDNVGIFHIGTGASTHKFPMLPAGAHRIIAVYAYGDHSIDRKVAQDTVNIIVK